MFLISMDPINWACSTVNSPGRPIIRSQKTIGKKPFPGRQPRTALYTITQNSPGRDARWTRRMAPHAGDVQFLRRVSLGRRQLHAMMGRSKRSFVIMRCRPKVDRRTPQKKKEKKVDSIRLEALADQEKK